MRKKAKRPAGKDTVALRRTVRLLVVILLIYTAAFLISALIVHSAGLSRTRVRLVTLTALSAASLLCGALTGRTQKKNGALLGALFCLPWITLLLFLSVLLSEGAPDLTMILSAVLLLLCAAVGGSFGVNDRSKQKRLLKGRRP